MIPERLVGYGRRQQIVARDVVLAIDGGDIAAWAHRNDLAAR